MARGQDTSNHEGRKVGKITQVNKTFPLPQNTAQLSAMRQKVDAKLSSPDKGPSISDIRSAVKKGK